MYIPSTERRKHVHVCSVMLVAKSPASSGRKQTYIRVIKGQGTGLSEPNVHS